MVVCLAPTLLGMFLVCRTCGGKIVKAQIVQMYKLQPLLQPRFLRRSMLMR
jgi:hypothetical protein